MQLLRAATLTVPNTALTADRYARWLDYCAVERGKLPADLAASWGAPVSTGRDYCVLQPASGADVFIRLVEGDVEPAYLPLRTYGWAAIEICVQDTLAVNDRMAQPDSPFEIIGKPRELEGMSMIFPMQVKGPDQEIVYLTQIRENPPDTILPRAESLIDKLFILVLACSDVAETMRWFNRTIGITTGVDVEITYTMISKAFDLPPGQKTRMITGNHGLNSFLEFDQYPPAATQRPGRADALKPGIAMATLKHPDFDSIKGDWITPPSRRDGAIYGGGRVGTLRAPDESLIEIVELI